MLERLLLMMLMAVAPALALAQGPPNIPGCDPKTHSFNGAWPAGQRPPMPKIRAGSYADPNNPNTPYCGINAQTGRRVCNLTLMLDEAEAEERGYIATDEQKAQGYTSLDIYKIAMCKSQKAATGVSCRNMPGPSFALGPARR
jgi:hypothetical protein